MAHDPARTRRTRPQESVIKGDPHPAAVRLCATCTVRTHYASPIVAQQGGYRARKYAERSRPPANPGRGRGGANARAVIVQGKRYASIAAAVKALKIGNTRIYMWIDSGRARYAGAHE